MSAVNVSSLGEAGRIETCLVVSVDRPACVVQRKSGHEVHARIAVSCLVAPEPGDRVLVHESFVLAVLERPSDRGLELAVDGDLAVRAEGKLELRGERVDLLGKVGRAAFDEVELFASRVGTIAEHARSVVGRVESLFDHVTERVRTRYREIEEREITRAGELETHARGTISVKAHHVSTVAEELVRFDGEQIHMG